MRIKNKDFEKLIVALKACAQEPVLGVPGLQLVTLFRELRPFAEDYFAAKNRIIDEYGVLKFNDGRLVPEDKVDDVKPGEAYRELLPDHPNYEHVEELAERDVAKDIEPIRVMEPAKTMERVSAWAMFGVLQDHGIVIIV